MRPADIALQRLVQQRLAYTGLTSPAEVVSWLGAVQSQDYAGAKWALAQRMTATSDEAIDHDFAEGRILRTHVLRPTWHFVTPADIRWMLALTAPRVNAVSAYYFRKSGLDSATFKRSNAALVKALQGGQQLTRPELAAALEAAGIDIRGELRLGYLMMRAELDAVMCSGGRRGKQFTYALLDERVPQSNPFNRDEALAELTRRYFTSRGPATVKDYVWWSGLTTADARKGIAMVRSQLVEEIVEGQTYWLPAVIPVRQPAGLIAHLLPNYDELYVGYKDRSAMMDVEMAKAMDSRGGTLFSHGIAINGHLVGMWKRTLKKDTVIITAALFSPFSPAEQQAFEATTQRYGEFLGLKVVVE